VATIRPFPALRPPRDLTSNDAVASQDYYSYAPPPFQDGFVMYDGTACAFGSACYDNYIRYPYDPAAGQAIYMFFIGDDLEGCKAGESGFWGRAGSCFMLGMTIIP